MSDQSILVRPKPTYWLNYLWLMPVAGFVFTAVIGGGICQMLGHKLSGRDILIGWGGVTLLLTLFALNVDRRKPHFELTDSTLRIGRGSYATVIPLEEIESAVFGLPESRGTHHAISSARMNSLFIRFGNGQYVPLCLYYNWMSNGRELMEALRERLREKMVGAQSYTAAEVKALRLAKFNRVGVLRA